jgi:hypothetical protein
LEHIFDRTLPAGAQYFAPHGSPARGLLLLLRVRGEAACFAAMASGQIGTLRQRRADGVKSVGRPAAFRFDGAKRKGRDRRGPSLGRKSPKDLQARSGRIRSRPANTFYNAFS